MHHAILTRFNLSVAEWGPSPNLDTGWLERRVRLFERYCAPAVAAQTVGRFRWVVMVDPATPGWVRDRVSAAAGPAGKVADVEGHDPARFEAVCASLFGGGPLLTSRLDSDDVIAVDFVARVQRAATRPGFYDLVWGLVLDVSTGLVSARRYPLNMFQSRLSLSGETVYARMPGGGVDHTRNHEVGRVRRVVGLPAWMIVAHGGNLSNRFDDVVPVPASVVRRRFPAVRGEVAPRRPGDLVRTVVAGGRMAAGGVKRRVQGRHD